jgi:hypothetical protein
MYSSVNQLFPSSTPKYMDISMSKMKHKHSLPYGHHVLVFSTHMQLLPANLTMKIMRIRFMTSVRLA